ncbi:MAG: SRPBCC family protein [Bryobacteraceae bacterium]
MATRNKSNVLRLTRVYNAPVQAVWDAWTDLEQVAQWWGPRGFTITTHSKDLRAGGTWVYTMHGPDGTDYPNIATYFVVKERETLEYDHGASEGKPALFRVHVGFSESNGKTTMDMTMTLATPEAAEEIEKHIKKASGYSTWDRLGEYLEEGQSGKATFVINRSFDISVERMFEMWTDPKHFPQWLPPTGMEMQILRGEIKQGSSIFWLMTGPHMKLYGRFEYKEVRRPDRISYTQQFCDENEGVSRHPYAPTWPETMLTTVDLTPEGPEQTRLTVRMEPYGPATSEEIEAFLLARGGMTQGWTGSFDKFDEVLAKLADAREL